MTRKDVIESLQHTVIQCTALHLQIMARPQDGIHHHCKMVLCACARKIIVHACLRTLTVDQRIQ